MGTITHLHEHLRPVPSRIDAEDAVVAIASALRPTPAEPTREAAADILGPSGLLAVSVPSDFGGLDVSNIILADAVALLAELSQDLAEAFASHCVALETVRSGGSDEQRRSVFARVASGDRFSGPAAIGIDPEGITTSFEPEGMGFRLTGRAEFTRTSSAAEWLAVPALSDQGKVALLLISRGTPGIVGQPLGDAGHVATVVFDGVHVAADAVLPLSHQAPAMSEALARLLAAAILLGRARRLARERLAATTDVSGVDEFLVGKGEVEIETLGALLARVAEAIDVAQVNASATAIADARRLASILGIAARGLNDGRLDLRGAEPEVKALGRQAISARQPRSH